METYIVVCTIQGEEKMCPFPSVLEALKFVRTATSETEISHVLRVDRYGNTKMFQIGFSKTLLFVAVDEVMQ